MLKRVAPLIRGDLILTVQNLPFPYQMNQCVCKLVEIHYLIPTDGQNRTYSLTVNTVKTAFSLTLWFPKLSLATEPIRALNKKDVK